MAATAMSHSSSTSSTPWKSTTDPKDFVGCKIEIISNSDIRYVGTLYTFDPHASTISLKDVQSYGTESRRSGDQAVAPSGEQYEYIVFRVSDIKDLVICEPPSPNARKLSLMDPAIVNASDDSGSSRQSAFPRIRYAPEFVQSARNSGSSSWGDNNRANGNQSGGGNNNQSRSSGPGNGGNRGSNGNGNPGAGQQNRGTSTGQGGGRGRGAGGRRGTTRGRGYGNVGNRRGAPVFPYPNQAGPQDWLTRYQKDMNLKAEFQNVNPDLSVLANIASSSDLPAEKVRDMMEGNWEAFITASKLPGKSEEAHVDKKPEYKDDFFDNLTAPPPNPNEPIYNWRKDVQTFGPAVPNNQGGNRGGQGGSGGNNNNQQPQQSSGGGGGWGSNSTNQQQQGQWGNNNRGGQQQQRTGWGGQGQQQGQGGWGQPQQQGGNRRGAGGRGRGRGGRMNGNGGGQQQQRGPMGSLGNFLTQNSGQGNNGFGFQQRDLVIPAQSSSGSNGTNWTFNQRTQAALWTPAVGLDLASPASTPATNWTFACASPAISESGYDALSPSPCA